MDSRRRVLDSSEESSFSPISSTLRTEIDLTNQLSALLDNERCALVKRDLDISDTTPPNLVLVKVLTLDPFISAASSSSFAKSQHLAQQDATIGYRTIGFGQCGIVYERPGRNFVIKIARPHFEEALWSDLTSHFQVWNVFQRQDLVCRVPRVYSYVNKTNETWWNENMPLIPDKHPHESFPLPAMVLISERILPLPRPARQALLERYCPEALRISASLNPSNRDCLARVYLGRRRPVSGNSDQPPPAPNFTLRNYNLYLDQMLELGLNVNYFAAAIAEALAVVHWGARVDAYDVEFVLGSDAEITYSDRDVFQSLNLHTAEQIQELPPHTDLESMMRAKFPRRTSRLWILDFNLCSTWKSEIEYTEPDALISQLVLAFFENDPYYPLPLAELEVERDLWNVFSTSYLKKAGAVMGDAEPHRANLSHKFIAACVERERDAFKLDRGLGHGHRELKG